MIFRLRGHLRLSPKYLRYKEYGYARFIIPIQILQLINRTIFEYAISIFFYCLKLNFEKKAPLLYIQTCS